MTQTRREFLKTTAASGVALVFSRVELVGQEAWASAPDKPQDWKGLPGKANYRIDGFAKVTGQKIS